MNARTLQLMVAEGCNLSCDYCFEHHKSPRFMDWATAKAAVDTYLTIDDGYDEVIVDLMGGEPMLAFPLIQRLVEYVESRSWPLRYHFSMSTNGTLFTEENRSWFISRKGRFSPMLSLDGTKIAHDLNRSHSYDKIMENLDFFRDNWPLQSVKMTINPRSLPFVADGIFSILAMGLRVEPSLVYEDVWGQGETKQGYLRLLEYELARLVDFYTDYPTLEAPRLVNLPLESCLKKEHDVWCGAGQAMVTISLDGVKYPCHRFLALSAGKGLTWEEYHDPLRTPRKRSACDDCPMVAACPTCQGHDWECSGSPYIRAGYNCDLLKLQMVASAALRVNRIHLVLSRRTPAEIDNETLVEIYRRLEAANLTFRVLAEVPKGELKPYVSGEWPGGPNWDQRTCWHDRRDCAVA